jgi:hypothetical protein
MNLLRTTSLALGFLLGGVALAGAQDVVAEVETWRGAMVRLEKPSLEVLYTIAPAPILGRTGAAVAEGGSAPAAAAAGGTAVNVTMGKTIQDTPIGAGPAPIQGRRSQQVMTFVRQGVEVQVPFDRIAAMLVEQRPVTTHGWPRYAEPITQSLATVTLVDGATIEAANVNFGTALLRGVGPQGTIELPLGDVKTLKIKR